MTRQQFERFKKQYEKPPLFHELLKAADHALTHQEKQLQEPSTPSDAGSCPQNCYFHQPLTQTQRRLQNEKEHPPCQ